MKRVAVVLPVNGPVILSFSSMSGAIGPGRPSEDGVVENLLVGIVHEGGRD